MSKARTTIRPRQRGKLRERADDRCEICGRYANNAHHRKNRSQGGDDRLSNMLLLCGSGTTGCHGYVTAPFKNSPLHPANPKEMGWTCWRSEDPASKPVMYRGQWAMLDDDGNVNVIQKGRDSNAKCPSGFRGSRDRPPNPGQLRTSDASASRREDQRHSLF